MIKAKHFPYFLVLLFLTSCASTVTRIPPPTPHELSVADYGEYPSDYQTIIKDYLHWYLVDPDSIKGLKISEPKPGYTKFDSDFFSNPPSYGYLCSVVFNSKNKMGGYVGYKTFLMVIKNGKVIFSRDDVGEYNSGTIAGYKQ